MNLTFLKRQCQLWGVTFAGLLLLFVAGFAVSIWNGDNLAQNLSTYADNISLGWWRVGGYILLLLLWPRLVRRLASNRQSISNKLASRRPLVVLILLYELLIVQNPLATLLKLVA